MCLAAPKSMFHEAHESSRPKWRTWTSRFRIANYIYMHIYIYLCATHLSHCSPNLETRVFASDTHCKSVRPIGAKKVLNVVPRETMTQLPQASPKWHTHPGADRKMIPMANLRQGRSADAQKGIKDVTKLGLYGYSWLLDWNGWHVLNWYLLYKIMKEFANQLGKSCHHICDMDIVDGKVCWYIFSYIHLVKQRHTSRWE